MKFAETAGMMNEGSGYIWFRKCKGKCKAIFVKMTITVVLFVICYMHERHNLANKGSIIKPLFKVKTDNRIAYTQ
jgi:hypothetical protein